MQSYSEGIKKVGQNLLNNQHTNLTNTEKSVWKLPKFSQISQKNGKKMRIWAKLIELYGINSVKNVGIVRKPFLAKKSNESFRDKGCTFPIFDEEPSNCEESVGFCVNKKWLNSIHHHHHHLSNSTIWRSLQKDLVFLFRAQLKPRYLTHFQSWLRIFTLISNYLQFWRIEFQVQRGCCIDIDGGLDPIQPSAHPKSGRILS